MAKTLTFFYSPDCGGCEQLEPQIRAAARRKGYRFRKVNVEDCKTDVCDGLEWVPAVRVGGRELSINELERLIDG